MAPRGTIFPLTVDKSSLQIPYEVSTDLELTIQGSLVAPRQVHKEMIEFAALHGIKPIIEKFPLTREGITEAVDKLNTGKMRYRAVIVAE